jgi:hypothetical protein
MVELRLSRIVMSWFLNLSISYNHIYLLYNSNVVLERRSFIINIDEQEWFFLISFFRSMGNSQRWSLTLNTQHSFLTVLSLRVITVNSSSLYTAKSYLVRCVYIPQRVGKVDVTSPTSANCLID